MTKILVQEREIVAVEPFVESDNAFETANAVIPKSVIRGWQMLDVELPENFEPSKYEFDGVGIVPKPTPTARPTAPRVVTMRQARLALLDAGLLDDVDAAITAIAEPGQRRAAQIEWDYSSEVHRDKQLVAMLAPALNLTDDQLDELFITASEL